MTAYYVIAIVIAVGAIVLSAIGLTRADFPPTRAAARAVMAGAAVLVLAGVVTLLATSEREHPREEAAEAAERAAEEPAAAERGAPAEGEGGGAAQGGPARVEVVEDEFSIALEGGAELEAGPHTFAVANQGQIEHDLAIAGETLREEPKTPLLDGGQTAELEVDLEPGEYRFYCTVPGHAQSGMEIDVTVR